MVLDGVVRAALAKRVPSFQLLGDFRPLITVFLMRFKYYALFALTPRLLVDAGVEVIVPSTSPD